MFIALNNRLSVYVCMCFNQEELPVNIYELGHSKSMWYLQTHIFWKKKKKKIQNVICCLSLWVNFSADDILKYFLIFPRKQNLAFHANCLQWQQFS